MILNEFLLATIHELSCCLPRLRKDLYCVEWDINLYYSISAVFASMTSGSGMVEIYVNEKVLGETQTLCAGRSNAKPNIFSPAAEPFSGAQDGQNLISWRWSLPLPTDPVWWKSMHTILSYRGNRHRLPARPLQTCPQTGPITMHCAAKLRAQCNKPQEWDTAIMALTRGHTSANAGDVAKL